jgi:ribosome maturation factor RimP
MGATIPEKLRGFIKDEAKRAGYQILDMSLKGGSGSSLEIIMDRQGGITLGECSDFNKKVSLWIEKSDISGVLYTVDVASPGLDRVLKSEADLEWAKGKQITATTYEPVNGKRHFEGKLSKVMDDEVILEQVSGDTMCLKKKNIAKAQLKIEI